MDNDFDSEFEGSDHFEGEKCIMIQDRLSSSQWFPQYLPAYNFVDDVVVLVHPFPKSGNIIISKNELQQDSGVLGGWIMDCVIMNFLLKQGPEFDSFIHLSAFFDEHCNCLTAPISWVNSVEWKTMEDDIINTFGIIQ